MIRLRNKLYLWDWKKTTARRGRSNRWDFHFTQFISYVILDENWYTFPPLPEPSSSSEWEQEIPSITLPRTFTTLYERRTKTKRVRWMKTKLRQFKIHKVSSKIAGGELCLSLCPHADEGLNDFHCLFTFFLLTDCRQILFLATSKYWLLLPKWLMSI